MDPELLTFLRDRLVEERAAAETRTSTRGLGLLEEILTGLDQGREPDRMSLDLLVVAYAGHPGFDPAWNRWRRAADRSS